MISCKVGWHLPPLPSLHGRPLRGHRRRRTGGKGGAGLQAGLAVTWPGGQAGLGGACGPSAGWGARWLGKGVRGFLGGAWKWMVG